MNQTHAFIISDHESAVWSIRVSHFVTWWGYRIFTGTPSDFETCSQIIQSISGISPDRQALLRGVRGVGNTWCTGALNLAGRFNCPGTQAPSGPPGFSVIAGGSNILITVTVTVTLTCHGKNIFSGPPRLNIQVLFLLYIFFRPAST